MAFYVRYGIAPTARAWHATKARQDGGDDWRRYLEGWLPLETGSARGERSTLRWPPPGAVAREFGSMSSFRSIVCAELAKRARAGTPYVPALPPAQEVELARTMALTSWGLAPAQRRRGSVPSEVLAPAPDLDFHGRRRFDPRLPARPAMLSSADGPIAAPAREGRGFWAVVGDSGTGKTSHLWRIALSDAVERDPRLLVIERSTGPIAVLVEAAGATDFVDVTHLSATDLTCRLAEHRAIVVRTDDAQIRSAWSRAARSLATQQMSPPISLVIDDADDMKDELLLLLDAVRSQDLAVTAAWAVTGDAADRRLLVRCKNLSAFRAAAYEAAVAVVYALNRKQEELSP